MIRNSFEDYLQRKCAKENPMILDDDWPDMFDKWLENISIDEWIELAEKYAEIFANNKK